MPFWDQLKVPQRALEQVYTVIAGSPCTAFSLGGARRGLDDCMGQLYIKQLQGYIRAQVPVILLEQVPEVADVPRRGDTPSVQQMLAEILRAAGYHVPETNGSPGVVLTASEYGSPVHRRRLFTVAVHPDLWACQGDKFEWPRPKVNTVHRTAMDILREPKAEYLTDPSGSTRFKRVSPEHPRRMCKPRKVAQRSNALGNWYDPNQVYDIEACIPSPTAAGNTRYFEWTDIKGKVWYRRLAPLEIADAFGIDMNLLQHLKDNEIYRVVLNSVPRELGQQIGAIATRLWNPKWWSARQQNRRLTEYEPVKAHPLDPAADSEMLLRQFEARVNNLERLRPGNSPARGARINNQEVQVAERCSLVQGVVTEFTKTRHRSAKRVQIKEAQLAENAWSRNIYLTLMGQEPSGLSSQDLEQLKHTATEFVLQDELLYKKSQATEGPGLLLCIPNSMQDKLVNYTHYSRMTVHPRAETMRKLIELRYYWPHIRTACEQCRKKCHTCKITGNPPPRAKVIQFVPTGRPLSVVAMDVVGPIGPPRATTERGNRFIVTFIDWFTRWVTAYAVPDTTAKTIGECIEKFTLRWGVPERMISDNAAYFRDKALREYERLLGMKHTFVSPHRPEGNGRLERFHRTLGRMLKARTEDTGKENWDLELEHILFAYNIAEHSTTGFSPWYLLHGWHPALPFDIWFETEEEPYTGPAQWVVEHQRRIDTSHSVAHERIIDAAHARVTAAEDGYSTAFQVGDKVLLWTPSVPRGMSRKLHCRWHGPGEI